MKNEVVSLIQAIQTKYFYKKYGGDGKYIRIDHPRRFMFGAGKRIPGYRVQFLLTTLPGMSWTETVTTIPAISATWQVAV